MRLMSFLVVVFLLTVTAFAQSAAGWCEVEEPAEPILPKPLSVVDDLPQIAELAPLPPNSSYGLYDYNELKLSTDGTRAVTSIVNHETYQEELVGIDLEDNSVYFRLPYSVIETLRPPITQSYFLSVRLRNVEWMGDSHRLALQTTYLCSQCEGQPAPDDLYVIDEQGRFKTLLKDEPAGQISISPDGKYVLVGDEQTISMIDARDGSRRHGLIPNFNGDIAPYGMPHLYNIWESEQSTLVISHEGAYDDLAAPIDIWRVFVDGQPSELVRQFDGVFDDKLGFDSSQQYIGYLWMHDREKYDYAAIVQDMGAGGIWDILQNDWYFDYDLIVQELSTGETWDLAQETAYPNLLWRWTSLPATLLYYDRSQQTTQHRFFAPCQPIS